MVQVKDHAPNYNKEQFFFSDETLTNLEGLLLPGRTACLCTPTLHEHLINSGMNTTLFDIDQKMLDLFGHSAYKLDLNMQAGAQIARSLLQTYQTVVIDPPFDTVELTAVAERTRELLDFVAPDGRIILTHQETRRPIIEKVFGHRLGLIYRPELTIPIRYDSRFDEFLTPIKAFVFDKPQY